MCVNGISSVEFVLSIIGPIERSLAFLQNTANYYKSG